MAHLPARVADSIFIPDETNRPLRPVVGALVIGIEAQSHRYRPSRGAGSGDIPEEDAFAHTLGWDSIGPRLDSGCAASLTQRPKRERGDARRIPPRIGLDRVQRPGWRKLVERLESLHIIAVEGVKRKISYAQLFEPAGQALCVLCPIEVGVDEDPFRPAAG